MGFRFRKSLRLMPGVRLTLSRRGLSASAGPRGARLSINTSGRMTRTFSLPGTGISHVRTIRPRPARQLMSILKALWKRSRTS